MLWWPEAIQGHKVSPGLVRHQVRAMDMGKGPGTDFADVGSGSGYY